jgi:hypothetical protein
MEQNLATDGCGGLRVRCTGGKSPVRISETQDLLSGAKEVERLITMVPVGRNQKREKGFSQNNYQGGFNYEN